MLGYTSESTMPVCVKLMAFSVLLHDATFTTSSCVTRGLSQGGKI